MKKTLLVFLLLALCPVARAENIPITITDRVYSDGIWYPGSATTISPNNKDGLAWRFVLDEAWTVSSLSGFMTGVDLLHLGTPQFGKAQFFLYQGSAVNTSQNYLKPPDQYFFSTELMNVPLDSINREYKKDVNLELPAGDYWFRADGGSGEGVIHVTGMNMEGTVTTPEPATLLLLGGGLLAGLRFRKKA